MSTRSEFDASALSLIAVTDSLHDGTTGLLHRLELAVRGGATMIQVHLPDESPRVLVEVTRAVSRALPHVPVLVSDRADVALAAGAHGVHLGVHEMGAAIVRRCAPPGFVIGASVGSDVDVSRVRGADFVAIGPVFASSARFDSDAIGVARFSELAVACGLPAVAIGGVTAANAADVMRCGAAGVAVRRGLAGASDPTSVAESLAAAIRSTR